MWINPSYSCVPSVYSLNFILFMIHWNLWAIYHTVITQMGNIYLVFYVLCMLLRLLWKQWWGQYREHINLYREWIPGYFRIVHCPDEWCSQRCIYYLCHNWLAICVYSFPLPLFPSINVKGSILWQWLSIESGWMGWPIFLGMQVSSAMIHS